MHNGRGISRLFYQSSRMTNLDMPSPYQAGIVLFDEAYTNGGLMIEINPDDLLGGYNND